MTIEDLRFLFEPSSIVVVGATDDPTRLAEPLVRNLRSAGYEGQILGVNRRRISLEGADMYTSIAELPIVPECAYVMVSAPAAVEAVKELGALGTRVAVVAAFGFSELGSEAGRELQRQLEETSRRTGIRIVGPNSNGVYKASSRLSLGFNTAHGWAIDPGRTAVISHSGALFSTIVSVAKKYDIGLSGFVSVGNEADLTELDYLEYFLADEHTSVIAMILDSLSSGPRFAELSREAERLGKKILVLKLGQSDVGTQVAVAHSSRVAGQHRSYAAFFRHHGVVEATSLEGLIGSAALAETHRIGAASSIGVVTVSGGASALVADAASRHGVQIPPRPRVGRPDGEPGNGRLTNPIDIGDAKFDGMSLRHALDQLAESDDINALVHYYHPAGADAEREERLMDLVGSSQANRMLHVLIAPGGVHPAEIDRLSDAGVLVFDDTDTAMEALSAQGVAPPTRRPEDVATEAPTPTAEAESRPPMDENESLEYLRSLGIPVVSAAHGRLAEDFADLFARENGPFVAKAIKAGVGHKLSAGYIRRDVWTLADVADFIEATASSEPDYYLIQPQLTAQAEVVIGVTFDESLGHFLVLGLGGTFVEELEMVTVLPPTDSAELIADEIRNTPLGKVLTKFDFANGGNRLDRYATFAASIGAVLLSDDNPIHSLDINPLMVTDEDFVAVDCLLVPRG